MIKIYLSLSEEIIWDKKSFGWNLKSLAKILIQDRAIGLGVLFILLIVLENNIFFKLTITLKVLLILILYSIGYKLI